MQFNLLFANVTTLKTLTLELNLAFRLKNLVLHLIKRNSSHIQLYISSANSILFLWKKTIFKESISECSCLKKLTLHLILIQIYFLFHDLKELKMKIYLLQNLFKLTTQFNFKDYEYYSFWLLEGVCYFWLLLLFV